MKNLLLKIGVVLIIILTIFASCVQAAQSYTKFCINPERADSSGRYIYAFSNSKTGKLSYVWNIQPYTNGTPIDTNNVFYCLAQGYGSFGNNEGFFGTAATVGAVPITEIRSITK